MSLKDLFTFNISSGVHLRDARHAHQIYTQNNFTFAPKAQFMYHVVFVPNSEVGNSATSNTFSFQKELGIMVKNADLPSYRVSVENKQQYNRKKNVQTRLDYQDVRITLHDDNLGAVRAMLEEYYKYYFQDGNKQLDGVDGAFQPRDKYFAKVPNYGLNNKKYNPFFKYITIYQLSRRTWHAYTLVNPLLTAWDHGQVDSTSTDFNSASMTVAYESVLYSTGSVADDTPPGFSESGVGYDVEPSPLGVLDSSLSGNTTGSLIPSLIGLGTSALLNKAFGNKSKGSNNILKEVGTGILGGIITNVLTQDKIPVVDSQNIQESSTLSNVNNSRILSTESITTSLSNPTVQAQVMPAIINSGLIPNVSITDFNNASPTQRANYTQQALDKIQSGDAKSAQVASNAINNLGP